MECGAAEDRCSNGAYCLRVSVVMGNVIDIGGSVRWYDIPFKRVSKTAYPMRRHIPTWMLEHSMSQRNRSLTLKLGKEASAGIGCAGRRAMGCVSLGAC